MLSEYAANHGFTNCRYYVDDGITGATFDRDDFNRMIADVEQYLIGTVIVKDLSRLGRNYLEADRYMEMVFPSYDVRFIAIGDQKLSHRKSPQTPPLTLRRSSTS